MVVTPNMMVQKAVLTKVAPKMTPKMTLKIKFPFVSAAELAEKSADSAGKRQEAQKGKRDGCVRCRILPVDINGYRGLSVDSHGYRSIMSHLPKFCYVCENV